MCITVADSIKKLEKLPADYPVFTKGGDHRYHFTTFADVEVRDRASMFIPQGVYLGGVE